MADRTALFAFLRAPRPLALTLLLIVQILLLYGASRQEITPVVQPLRDFPVTLDGWKLAQEGVVEKEIQEVLRADDFLTRTYVNAAGRTAAFFVAYFKSQRTGVAPHSPKNCLPGSGWVPTDSRVISIPVPGRAQPIEVNHYLVARGEARSVVLYWYESHGRVIASEYAAKVYLVADAIRYNRTDTALVRIAVPVAGDGEDAARDAAIAFAQACFLPLRPFVSD